jgi:hypothetical protein
MRKTNFPRAEPALRTILDTWESIGREHIGKPDIVFSYTDKMRRDLYAAGRDLMAKYRSLEIPENDWPGCMWWTYRRMVTKRERRGLDALSVTSPRSLAWGAVEWMKNNKGSEMDRQKYLRGVT